MTSLASLCLRIFDNDCLINGDNVYLKVKINTDKFHFDMR